MVLRRLKPADVSWIAVLVGVTVYEVVASRRGWELLSQAVDRYRQSNPAVTDASVIYIAAHLLRRWPTRLDPLAGLAKLVAR